MDNYDTLPMVNPNGLTRQELNEAPDLRAAAFPDMEPEIDYASIITELKRDDNATAEVVTPVPAEETPVAPTPITELLPVKERAKQKMKQEIDAFVNMDRKGSYACIIPTEEREKLTAFLNDRIDADEVLAENICKPRKSIENGMSWCAKHLSENCSVGMAVASDLVVFEMMLDYFAFDEEKAEAEAKAKREADEARRKEEKAKQAAEKRKATKAAKAAAKANAGAVSDVSDKQARLDTAKKICDSVMAGEQLSLFAMMDQQEENIPGILDAPLTATDQSLEEKATASSDNTVTADDLDGFPFGFAEDVEEPVIKEVPKAEPEELLPFTLDASEEKPTEADDALPWEW